MLDSPLVRGGIAGTVATLPMSAVMLVAQKAGLMGEQPPEKITEAALHLVGVHGEDESTRHALTVLAHFGYGTTCGLVYVAIVRALARRVPGPASGALFGLALWAASYAGWIPRLRIMPVPDDDRPGRPASMIAAHLVFGAALGALARQDQR